MNPKRHALIVLAALVGGQAIASPETSEVWAGAEIVPSATKDLGQEDLKRLADRIKASTREHTIEEQLWIVIDLRIADAGGNYGGWQLRSTIYTALSEPVYSELTLQRARAVVEAQAEDLPGFFERYEAVEGERQFERITFTGDTELVPEGIVRHERRQEFARGLMEAILNILALKGDSRDLPVLKEMSNVDDNTVSHIAKNAIERIENRG